MMIDFSDSITKFKVTYLQWQRCSFRPIFRICSQYSEILKFSEHVLEKLYRRVCFRL